MSPYLVAIKISLFVICVNFKRYIVAYCNSSYHVTMSPYLVRSLFVFVICVNFKKYILACCNSSYQVTMSPYLVAIEISLCLSHLCKSQKVHTSILHQVTMSPYLVAIAIHDFSSVAGPDNVTVWAPQVQICSWKLLSSSAS